MKKFFTTERGQIGELDVFTIKSNALGNRADLSVFKPPGDFTKMPIVILLHGVYGSHWAWSLKANVHQTLKTMIANQQVEPMLLVMPSDGLFQDGSGYLKHHNADYEKWIVEDVVSVVKDNYKEVNDASPVFLAGLSMGGYGALRLGAKYPNVFKAFSGLSSITRFEQMGRFVENFDLLKQAIESEENVIDIMLANKASLRPFRFDCGKDDTLFEANQILDKQLNEHNIPHEFLIKEGAHSWEYWHDHIGETFLFFNEQI
jgi:putative tributyrin esterase